MGQAISEVLGEAGIPDPQITDLEAHRLDWVG
jgi:hypothetical protein